MIEFQPHQTVLNYIYHNKEHICKLLRTSYTYAQLAKLLTESNSNYDKISSTKLLHIIHYCLVKPRRQLNTTKYLEEFSDNEGILEYIKVNARAVVIHKRQNTYSITAQVLTSMCRCGEKISSQKLGDICSYIEEELNNDN